MPNLSVAIIRILQLLCGAIVLGVAAGGAKHLDGLPVRFSDGKEIVLNETSLKYMAFVGAWAALISILGLIITFWESLNKSIIPMVLDGLTLLFLIIGAIVVPVTLFKNNDLDDTFSCRPVLQGKFTGVGTNDAKIGCQCAIASTVFDVFSCLLWIAGLIMVIITRRQKFYY